MTSNGTIASNGAASSGVTIARSHASDSEEVIILSDPLTPVENPTQDPKHLLLRNAQTEVARLSLELRVLQQDVEGAKRMGGFSHESENDAIGIIADKELIRSTVDQLVSDKMGDMARAVVQARAHASERVASAQVEAALIIKTARDEALDDLLKRVRPLLSAPPVLSAPPDLDLTETVVVPIPEPETEPVVIPLVEPTPLPAAEAPVAEAPVADLIIPVGDLVPKTSDLLPEAEPKKSPKKLAKSARFLYIDVILPLIAVLVVIILLLAWVG